MKNYRIEVCDDSDSKPLGLDDIFRISDTISQEEIKKCLNMRDRQTPIEERLKRIQSVKKNFQSILRNNEIADPLREYFHVDGAIKFNEKDLAELEKSFVAVTNTDEIHEQNDSFFEAYMMSLMNDFTYFRSKERIFRNPKFYFLFPSLTVDIKNRFTSINDYTITDINIKDFVVDFVEHYNTIDQNIQLFSTHIIDSLWKGLSADLPAFSKEISTLLSPEKLEAIGKLLKTTGNVGNQEVDNHFIEQGREAIEGLEFLRELIHDYVITKSAQSFSYIVSYISRQSLLLQYAKVSLGIDVDAVFNKYSKVGVTTSMRKVMLGLLDAKINMVAFMQNATQIMYSEQFMNPEFEGSLVLRRDTVRNIKSTCPREYADFKSLQKKLQLERGNHSLLGTLDSHVGYFMDILLEDNGISYAKIIGELPGNLAEITEGKTDMMRDELKDGMRLLESFFGLMDAYVAKGKSKLEQKNTEGNVPKTRQVEVREMAMKKLIRLYREENDPLVMIKTAQNALNMIVQKGFNPNQDILHVMGVNYGGTLVGLYVKYVFSKTIIGGKVLTNAGNIVYSIYDVKNANKFLELTDYPFAKIIKNKSIDSDTQKKISDRNWLLIFDDNTNSGETLDNLRIGAKESGLYGRINTFACRANYNTKSYKRSLTDSEKLDFMIHSAIPSRKAKVNPEGKRYKELLGTIVGNRIHKILQSKQ